MIQHVVLLKFPRPLNSSEEAELRALLEPWSTEIRGLRVIRFGTAIDAQHADGYQYLLHLEIEDEGALARYIEHPAHLRFGQWTVDHGCAHLVFDYNLDAQTVILDGRASIAS